MAARFAGAVGGVASGPTVNVRPLLATPAIVTRTFPVVAPAGTETTMFVALQLVGVADAPLNVTVLVPCVDPKLAPVIVTDDPTGPVAGLRLVMDGVGVMEKLVWLLARPRTTTCTKALALPDRDVGTAATILVLLQLVGMTWVELNHRTLEPWVFPKFVPVIAMDEPRGPEDGFKLLIFGAVAWTTVIVADADLVGSVTEVAVSVTPEGLGAVAGAL